MRAMKIGLACVSVLVAMANPVSAGKIFLSGDVNIGEPINGSSGAPLTAGNAQFFSNVLGTGKTVLIHDEYNYPDSFTVINSYFNGLGGGVTSSLDTSGTTITSGLLVGVDLFISALPSNSYTAGETSALASFLTGPGTVFFMGDNHTAVPTQNARINAVLSALGSSMSLGTATLDGGFTTTTNIDSDPYTSGISSFTFAAANNIVTGGTSLIRTASTSQTFIAYENTQVPEPGSIIAMLSLVSFGAGAVVIRRRRAKKLAA